MTDTEYLIQRIMDDYDVDRAEALDLLEEMQDDVDYIDAEERIGCGDCYGDAL